jgi:hypothetical protein
MPHESCGFTVARRPVTSREIGETGKSGVIIGCRPDRVRKKLPATIQDLIESGGGRGFRLRMA